MYREKSNMKRTVFQTALLVLSALWIATSPAAAAGAKVKIGFTAVTGFLAGMVAADHGFFAKHGIDAELVPIAIGTTIPSAMVSDSIQVGGPTPTVVLQANDAGLDIVFLTAASVFPAADPAGLVARFGSDIKTIADVKGARVGIPGMNGFLHVMFRRYLKSKGIDDSDVRYIEIPFPQFPDALKSGRIDAYPAVDPFYSRAIATKSGYDVANWFEGIPDGTLTVVFTATREWAEANPELVKGFRAAIAEATDFINDSKNEKAWRGSLAKHTRLPPPVVQKITKPNLSVEVTPQQVQFWIDLSKEQGLIKGNPVAANLIAK